MLLACAGRYLPGWRRDVAAAVSPVPDEKGLRRAAGTLKESGRDAGVGSRASVWLTCPGECRKVNW